jgi:hypothetical protein
MFSKQHISGVERIVLSTSILLILFVPTAIFVWASRAQPEPFFPAVVSPDGQVMIDQPHAVIKERGAYVTAATSGSSHINTNPETGTRSTKIRHYEIHTSNTPFRVSVKRDFASLERPLIFFYRDNSWELIDEVLDHTDFERQKAEVQFALPGDGQLLILPHGAVSLEVTPVALAALHGSSTALSLILRVHAHTYHIDDQVFRVGSDQYAVNDPSHQTLLRSSTGNTMSPLHHEARLAKFPEGSAYEEVFEYTCAGVGVGRVSTSPPLRVSYTSSVNSLSSIVHHDLSFTVPFQCLYNYLLEATSTDFQL